MNNINILAIETSCDETAAAVVQNGRVVLSNVVASQIEIHQVYGGVVPEIASRKHIEVINQVINQAIVEANLTFKEIDAIGVTYGPGLVGALLVGVSAAKSLAWALDLPLIGVHHISGHISANYITHSDLKPPFLCLVVSGGHSHIVYVKDYCKYELIGCTRDDAAGEAYDKVARVLGLGYPGGPVIDKLSLQGDASKIKLPKIRLKNGDYDFSFSGLKTAVVNYVHNLVQKNEIINNADIAAAFQKSVVSQLSDKVLKVCEEKQINRLVLAGGVAANSGLRNHLETESQKRNIDFYCPELKLCTDNAAMIGSDAYYRYVQGERATLSLNAMPQLKIDA